MTFESVTVDRTLTSQFYLNIFYLTKFYLLLLNLLTLGVNNTRNILNSQCGLRFCPVSVLW